MISRSEAVLLPAWKEATGEAPAIGFDTLVDVYTRDPAAKAAVDFLADQAVGMGFYTTAAEGFENVKKVVDDFNESVNLDELLQTTAREITGFGNSFWEKIEPERLKNLKLLPVTSIDKILRDRYGEVQGYRQTAIYGGKTLDPARITHFRWNPVVQEPFGTGILRSLCTQLKAGTGETRPSFMDMKAGIEKVMPEIFKKYAGPETMYIFEGASEKKLAEYQRLIKTMPKAGARWVYNKPGDIKTVAVDPRARFDGYVEHIWNQFILGLQTPLPKLFTTPGFTEASARAAIEVAERKVMALQRFVKRIVEREVFAVVIKQTGHDVVEADVRLNWGLPEKPEVEALLPMLADIARDRPDIISAKEFRNILIDMGLALEKTEEEA